MQLEINNINIRSAIHNILHFIIDEILVITFKIRQYEAGWSQKDYYSSLPSAELCNRPELSKQIEKWGLQNAGFDYDLVAVFGSQSTGKSA